MYVVTGGAGFIGSAIVWGLNQRGVDDILIVDSLDKTDKWKNLVPLRYADYLDQEAFLNLIVDETLDVKVKAIIHMGACSSTTEKDAAYLVRNNYRYSKFLAMFAEKNKIRFLYASSAATYGDGARGYDDDEDALETLRPLNMYGYSKQMFDLWACREAILKKAVGFKFTNVFGPNESHKGDMRSVVSKAYDQIRDTGKVRLFKSDRPDYADGEQKRDFIYVKDAVDIVLSFLENSHAGIVNVGSGRAESWNALAEAVFAALGKAPNIEYIDMPETLRGRYQYYTRANIDKLRKMGYTAPITPLNDAVRDYVTQYLCPDRHLGDGEANSRDNA